MTLRKGEVNHFKKRCSKSLYKIIYEEMYPRVVQFHLSFSLKCKQKSADRNHVFRFTLHHKSQPLEPADVFFIAKCQQQYWWENGTFSMVQIKKKEKKRKTEQKRTGSTDQLRHHSFSTYAKYFEKLKFLTPLCAYHWVRNVSFSENFA